MLEGFDSISRCMDLKRYQKTTSKDNIERRHRAIVAYNEEFTRSMKCLHDTVKGVFITIEGIPLLFASTRSRQYRRSKFSGRNNVLFSAFISFNDVTS